MEGVSLYLVPTPIGNLDDITLRSIKVLSSVDVILAEDTRTSGKLLKHHQISKPLQSYHIFNEHKTVEKLIARLQAGEVMALISDAGTPSISDPGFLLVREVLKAELEVSWTEDSPFRKYSSADTLESYRRSEYQWRMASRRR